MQAMTIGIAGGTGSGKTTVAEAILEAVGLERIAFLAADHYYRDIVWSSDAQLLAHNFDHPDALDVDLLVEHVGQLRQGRDVAAPVYDFVHHRRATAVKDTPARQVVLVEGILILALPEVRELLDLRIFVDTDADVRLLRRLRRDIRERGRTVDDVLRQYEGTVRPMHLEFVEPSKRWADVIIPEGRNQAALDMLEAHIERLLGTRPPLRLP